MGAPGHSPQDCVSRHRSMLRTADRPDHASSADPDRVLRRRHPSPVRRLATCRRSRSTRGRSAATRKPSLGSHIERVVSRLIALRGTEGVAPLPESAIDLAVQALDRIAEAARKARGDEREALIAELDSIDRGLMRCVAGLLDEPTSRRLRREAEEELAVFGERMPADARATAVELAYLRLVRETARLPRVAFD